MSRIQRLSRLSAYVPGGVNEFVGFPADPGFGALDVSVIAPLPCSGELRRRLRRCDDAGVNDIDSGPTVLRDRLHFEPMETGREPRRDQVSWWPGSSLE